MAKILIHTLLFPPDSITNAYILSDLARELRTYGHELTVLTTTPHYNLVEENLNLQPMTPVRGKWLLKSDFEGIPCYHIKVPPVKGGVGTRLKTALRFHVLALMAILGLKQRFDVVISQSPPLSIGLIGSWIARLCRAKAVYICQDIFPDGLIRQGKITNKGIIWVLKTLERNVYRSSNAVCGISKGFVEILRPRVPKRVLLEVIPNFVNTEVYRPLPRINDYAVEHGLDKRFVVSYVGNIGNAQDLGPVFAAARKSADLPISYIMVGDGMTKNDLEAQAKNEGLTGIEFWGYQPRESTPWINASSDICLVLLAPHVGNYGFPSKIFTLMASGKPIILVGDPASDIAQLVVNTGTGWVVPAGDPDGFADLIYKLYQERETIEAYGQRGVQAVEENFTVSRVGKKYHDLVTRLVSDK